MATDNYKLNQYLGEPVNVKTREMPVNTVLQGDALTVLRILPKECIQMCCTSPPFWGLRDYKTEPLIWGGKPECPHQWGNQLEAHHPGQVEQTKWKNAEAAGKGQNAGSGQFCSFCGAWRGSLGLEPTIDCFIEHLVEIFREVRRVLRPDGSLWLNMGDSYYGGKGKSSQAWSTKHQDRKTLQKSQHQICGKNETRPSDLPQIGLKPKDCCMIPARVALALQADGWYLRSQIPWLKRNCLSGGATVYVKCQKGDMPMMVKDLKRLKPETVKLWNGEKWTQLISIWENKQPGKPLEIELRSGERIGCTSLHKWPTMRGLIEAKDLQIGDLIQCAILPNSDGPTPAGLPDDIGWMIGFYLAEGCENNNYLTFSLHSKEINYYEKIESFADYFGCSASKFIYKNSMIVHLYGKIVKAIIKTFIAGEGAKTKHLSNACWMRNNLFLKNLLLGYLAGDGHYDKENDRWRLGFCNNDYLAQDLRTLCARLGISIRLKRAVASAKKNGKLFPIWRGQIRLNLTQKKGRNEMSFKKQPDNEIIAIRRSRARHFYDLAVKDKPNLFSLASGILTHNSMPESVTDRPATAVEYVFLLAKSRKYFYDAEAVKVGLAQSTLNDERNNSGRHTHGEKIGSKYGNENRPEFPSWYRGKVFVNPEQGRNRRNSDWFFESFQGLYQEGDDPLALIVNPHPLKEAHFATFPPKLVEPFIKAGTSERGCCENCGAPWERVIEKTPSTMNVRVRDNKKGIIELKSGIEGQYRASKEEMENYSEEKSGKTQTLGWRPTCACNAGVKPCVVLDPFMGAGTVALVAEQLRRNWLGIELNPEYIEIATRRLEKWRRESDSAAQQMELIE